MVGYVITKSICLDEIDLYLWFKGGFYRQEGADCIFVIAGNKYFAFGVTF